MIAPKARRRLVPSRLPLLALLLLFPFVLSPRLGTAGAVLAGDSWAAVRAAKKGRIAVAYFDHPDFARRGADGRLAGFEPAVVFAFQDWLRTEKGVALELDWVAFREFAALYGAVRDAESPGVFGISSISILPERDREVDFSPPYLPSFTVLVTGESVPELRDADSLRRALETRTALSVPGSTHEAFFLRIRRDLVPELAIEDHRSAIENLENVAREPDRFVTAADLLQLQLAKRKGLAVRRHPAFDRQVESLGVVLPQGSDWAIPLGEFLDPDGGFTRTRAYQDLVAEWFGRDFAMAMYALERKANAK